MRLIASILLVCIAGVAAAQNLPLLGAGGAPAGGGGSPSVVTSQTKSLALPTTANFDLGTLGVTNTPTTCSINAATDPLTHYAISVVAGDCKLRVTAKGANEMTTAGQDNITVTASNAFGGSSATIHINKTAVVGSADGFDGRSACNPNDPTYFAGYAVRPSWRVAGVDYCVGAPTIPPNGSYKDPATISDPGISRSGQQLFIHGSNITLDSYDFTGWYLEIPCCEGQSNLTITNNKFVSLGDDIFLDFSPLGGTNIIRNNTFDFAGLSANKDRIEINVCCHGSLDFSWNTMLNSWSDWLNYGGGSSTTHDGRDGTITFRYNYMKNAGLGGDAVHGDWMAATSFDLTQLTFEYNLFTQPDLGLTQGIGAPCSEGQDNGVTNTTVLNTIIKNNTIGPGLGQGYYFQVTRTMQMSITDNYIDPTGHPGSRLDWISFQDPISGFSSFCNGTQSKSGNVNMLTGGPIDP